MPRDYQQLCPIARTLDIIGDRWTLLVIRDLFLGATKFTEFRESSPGIPTKILSDRLKALESHGIVERRTYSEHPLRAEYYLTSLGRSFEPIVTALYEWGMKHTVSPAEHVAIRKRIAEGAAARGIAIKPPA